MTTATSPICLCGCTRSDEADEARRARAARAELDHAINNAAFDLYYDDLKAGRPTLAPAEYIALATTSATQEVPA